MQKYYVTVDTDGTTRWYKDAKLRVLHRVGGPAVEYANGDQYWLQNDRMHREDGPAVVKAGYRGWYLDGVSLTEGQHRDRTQPATEMTVAEIEAALGKRVKIIK